LWEYLKERNNLENLGLDGRRVLKWLFKKHNGGVDSIDLAQDRIDGVILWKE
jgi:aryl carrier-like protein